MALVNFLAAVLAWLGRQGTRAVALSVFAGLALPQLAAAAKPAFTPDLFFLLCLAFLRVDPGEVRRHFTRPALVCAAVFWIMIVIPVAVGTAAVFVGQQSPGLAIALVFQAASPPTISSPAFAALMGLDAALSLAVLIASAVATPLAAALFAALFLGSSLQMSAGTLGLNLLGLLGGAALVASLIRRAFGQAWIERQTERLDGLSVIGLFVFAVAIMDGVLAQVTARPLLVIGLLAFCFAIALAFGAATAALFARAGRAQALAIGVSAGARNMGLMLAATGGFVPDLTWLYVALAQFPIYLLPQFLKPVVKPLLARSEKRGITRS
jgi:predicted Na+-dependent transporter